MVQKCFINLILVVKNIKQYLQVLFNIFRALEVWFKRYLYLQIGPSCSLLYWYLEEFTIDPSLSHTFLFCSISHQFATCGDTCQLWEHGRNEPIRTFTWNVDSLHHVAFNPIDKHILTACASDRSIILYDTRATGMDN